MHRAQILIEKWHYEQLKSRSEREGRSISEIVREMLDQRFARRNTRGGLDDICGIANVRMHPAKDHDEILYGRRPRKRG